MESEVTNINEPLLTTEPVDRLFTRALMALAVLGMLLLLVFGWLGNRQFLRHQAADADVTAALESRGAMSTLAASFATIEQALLYHPDGDDSLLYRRSTELMGEERETLIDALPDGGEREMLARSIVTEMDTRIERLRGGSRERPLDGSLFDMVNQFFEATDREIAAEEDIARRARNSLGGLSLTAFITALSLGALMLWLIRRTVLRLAESRSALLETRSQLRVADTARSDAVHEQERVESLLEDMNHRIGNSLGMVSALMGLQRSQSQNEDVRAALDAARARIAAVATAHRRLRLSPDQSSTDLHSVLDGVALDLSETMPRRDIALQTEFAPMRTSDRDAVTVGLLMSELVTNAFKHAFDGRDGGTVWLHSGVSDGGHFELHVEDDGVGMPDPDRKRGGLGTSVIQRMSAQYGGSLDYAPRPGGGTRVSILLPKLEFTTA